MHRRAFTLVELLVVVGIIAILISVLLPALNRARESANKVKCLSNMKQVGLAYLMYAQDNKGTLPCFLTLATVNGKTFLGSSSTFGPFVGSVYTAAGAVAPQGVNDPNAYIGAGQRFLLKKPYGLSAVSYLRTTECFFCPSDNARRPYVDPATGWGPMNTLGLGAAGQSMSYFEWYRPVLDYRNGGVPTVTNSSVANGSLKVKQPAKKTIMADQGYIPSAISNPADDPTLATTYPFFHKKGYNVLYIDGHARWVGTEGIERWEKAPFKQNYQAAALSAFNEAGG